MAVQTSKLIVALIDQFTAPSRGLSAAMKNLTAASEANAAKLAAMRGKMMDAVGAGYALYQGLSAPLNAATAFEAKLEDIGQKIDTPVKALPKLGQEVREIARQVTQSTMEMAEGMDVLAGMGANREDSLALLMPIGRAATAYKASVTDLAQAGYAALDNLKVPADQFTKALDAMAEAGKAGAFELKDMAQYFPSLGAAYQGLGQTGVSSVADLAAALQIVRKGTGDSSSAANNLANVLQKIRAPQTVKAFDKMGVDLERELKAAAKRGLTPIEAIAEITNKALKGDLGKLGDLFSDSEVQKGIRPLIQNIQEYRRIRAEAMAAQGVVEADYQRRLQTGEMAAKRFSIAIENINTAIGAALLPALSDMADTLVPIINKMAAWAEANPELTRGLVTVASGLIAFKVAATAASFAGLFVKGAFLDLTLAVLKTGRALTTLGLAPVVGGLRALNFVTGGTAKSAKAGAKAAVEQAASLLSQRQAAYQSAVSLQNLARQGGVAGLSLKQATANVKATGAALVAAQADMKAANVALAATGTATNIVTGAFRAMKIALISTGVGAAVVGLAAAGIWIYNNWTGVTLAFEAFKGAFMKAMSPVMPVIQPVIDGVSWLWEKISNLLGPIDEMGGGWTRAGIAAGKFVGETLRYIIELPGKIIAAVGSFASAGMQLIQSLWDGMVQKFGELIEWVKGIPGRIAEAIGNIDLSGVVKWPFGLGGDGKITPAITGGGGAAAIPNVPYYAGGSLDGKRAAGGPVRGGGTYLVGEKGPELVTFPHNGFVSSNFDTLGILRKAVGSGNQGSGGHAAPAATQQTINVTVNAKTGASVQEIADVVVRTISAKIGSVSNRAYSDGGM